MKATDVTRHRGAFFRVLETTKQSQTAVMTVPPGEDAGPPETHEADQIIYVIEGEAAIAVGDQTLKAGPGAVLTIPPRTVHHVANPGSTPLFFLTVYAPPAY